MGLISQILFWLWPTVDLKYTLTLVCLLFYSQLWESPPRDPLIYRCVSSLGRRAAPPPRRTSCSILSVDLRRRLYEMLVVYSLPIKAIIHEKVR